MTRRLWQSTVLLGLLVGAFLIGTSAMAENAFESVSAEELDRLLREGGTVVDVRRVDEWRDTGVIAGSRLITAFDAQGRPNPRFLAEVAEAVDKDEPVALICRSGNRSAVAARFLAEQAGYGRVYNVSGGIRDWLGEGKPVAPCTSC